jgi:hypothetical protein
MVHHVVNDNTGQDDDTFQDEETAAFLADILRDTEENDDMDGYLSSNYTTTHASAMMMMDGFESILIDQEMTTRPRIEILVPSEVRPLNRPLMQVRAIRNTLETKMPKQVLTLKSAHPTKSLNHP